MFHLCTVSQVYELKTLKTEIQSQIHSLDAGEAEVVSTWLLEHYLQISRNDLLLNRTEEVSATQQNQLATAVARINQHEPIQYVLGEAYFYGRRFVVGPGVLIPRRETEELVALVVRENQHPGLRLLDIGTGSGCVAISLQQEMTEAEVHALDISSTAIEVARENVALHQAKVDLVVSDIFQDEPFVPGPWDIIVSNPPYVRPSEAARMTERVLSHEPHQALFVDEERPLIYYERIATLAQRWLRPGGKIYCEINEAMGEKLRSLLQKYGFTLVELHQDLQGKPRFVSGKLVKQPLSH